MISVCSLRHKLVISGLYSKAVPPCLALSIMVVLACLPYITLPVVYASNTMAISTQAATAVSFFLKIIQPLFTLGRVYSTTVLVGPRPSKQLKQII